MLECSLVLDATTMRRDGSKRVYPSRRRCEDRTFPHGSWAFIEEGAKNYRHFLGRTDDCGTATKRRARVGAMAGLPSSNSRKINPDERLGYRVSLGTKTQVF
jgi:hypothetical protein